MDMVYLLTWVGSLICSLLLYLGLNAWFKRAPTTTTSQTTTNVRVLPDRVDSGWRTSQGWKGGRDRLDRDPFYMCLMWALFVGGLLMLFGGSIHPSTIDAMDDVMQRAVAFLLCFGTGTCILGFTSGTRWFRPRADLRDCYRMAVIATPANVSTLAVYAAAVGNTYHWNLRLFGLGAGGILAVLTAHLLMAWVLYWEARRLDARVAEALRAVTEKARE